jgi:hypothetical protein
MYVIKNYEFEILTVEILCTHWSFEILVVSYKKLIEIVVLKIQKFELKYKLSNLNQTVTNILNMWIQKNLQSHIIKIQNLHTHTWTVLKCRCKQSWRGRKERVLLELQSYKTSSTLSIKLFYTLFSLCGVCIASLL